VPVTAYAPDVAKFESALFKPRGWSWVDPTKEVKAAKEAVMAGFTTVTDVIAQTAGGLDIEDVLKTRQRELVMFAEAEVLVDTTVQPPGSAASAKPGEPAEPVDPDENADDDDPPDSAAPPGGSAAGKTRQPHNGPQQRVVSLAR
jgi:capsid protein